MQKVAVLLCSLYFVSWAQAAPEYQLIDLGAKYIVSGMNNKGEVVGTRAADGVSGHSDFRSGHFHPIEKSERAARWDAANGWRLIPQLSSEMSLAYAIDDAGNIAGVTAKSKADSPWGVKRRAYVLKPDGQLIRYPSSTYESVAVGLAFGQAVGTAVRSGRPWSCDPFKVAMLWNPDTGTSIQHYGPVEASFCQDALGYSVDATGQVYGASAYRDWVIWTAGPAWWAPDQTRCTDGHLGSCRAPEPYKSDLNLGGEITAINQSGQAVGGNAKAWIEGGKRALMWIPALGRNAPPTDLGDLTADDLDPNGQTEAWAINAPGAVVGGYLGLAFIWTPERGMRNLNTLIGDASAHWKLQTALQINNQGWILAAGAKDGYYRACVLVPIGGLAGRP